MRGLVRFILKHRLFPFLFVSVLLEGGPLFQVLEKEAAFPQVISTYCLFMAPLDRTTCPIEYAFKYEKGQVYCGLRVSVFKEEVSILGEKEHSFLLENFVKIEEAEGEVFFHFYPNTLDCQCFFTKEPDEELEEDIDFLPYLSPRERFLLSDSFVKRDITKEECLDYIRKEGIRGVFYTGAGISAKRISTEENMREFLGMGGVGDSFGGLEYYLANAESNAEYMKKFFEDCSLVEPTDAHYAIKEILEMKQWGLVTDNVDLLHQKTGVNPFCLVYDTDVLIEEVKDDLKNTDVIITVGMRYDRRSLIPWFRELNPDGLVIAINTKKPSCLEGDDVLFLEGDAQEVLPWLSERLRNGN